MTTTMLEQLATQLQATQDRQGRWHADCPRCGAVAVRKRAPAYHFYLYDMPGKGRGAICWSCNYRASLLQLSRDIGTDYDPARDTPTTAAMVAPEPPWSTPDNWQRWQAFQATRIESTWQAWQSYRPYSRETVQRYGLAVERLTFWSDANQQWIPARYPRLLIPIVRESTIIGVRGRAWHKQDDGPKWISATGSETWLCGVEDVQPGQDVVWCESLADRILGAQQLPHVAFVAGGGITWQQEWIDALVKRSPRRVVVWFDHDLSGNGSPAHQEEWTQRWQQEMQRRRTERQTTMAAPTPPQPRGPQLCALLRDAGLKAHLYQWPASAPEHADLGWQLMQTGGVK